MILWYSKWYYDIQRERILKGMFQSIHYQLCGEMCPVSIVSVMCHQHLWNSLLQGFDSRCQKTDRVWYLALKNFKIPNSSASVYCTSRSKSPPTAAKSKFKFTSRIRSSPRPPRGAESSDCSDIRRKSWLRFPSSSWQSDTGWKLISLVRWNWEPNPRWLMHAHCTPPLGEEGSLLLVHQILMKPCNKPNEVSLILMT